MDIEEPFEKLEVVWASLESWFDLILVEVEKTSRGLSASEENGRVLLMRRMQSIDSSSGENATVATNRTTTASTSPSLDDNAGGSQAASPTTEAIGEVEKGSVATAVGFQARDPVSPETNPAQSGRSKGGNLVASTPQSNQLAAAIVNTTPVERRVAFLRYVIKL